MSALSSIFKGSDVTVKQSTKSNRPVKKEKRPERLPKIIVREGSDVLTEICAEIGKRVVSNPDVRTGKLFDIARDSNLPINQSDIIILISSSVLDEMGNEKAATKCLNSSATVEKMYERMGLNNAPVRKMFVTALISVNPALVKIIEASVTLALEKLRFETKAPHSEVQLENSLRLMKIDGSVSNAEYESMNSNRRDTDMVQAFSNNKRNNSIQTTPTELHMRKGPIAPSESASNIGGQRRTRRSNSVSSKNIDNEREFWNFLRKKKENPNLRFEAEYENELKPIQAVANYRRTGLFTNEDFKDNDNHAAMMDQILGARKQGSTIPISPSTVKVRQNSESSIEGFNREVPDMPSNLGFKETPDVRTNVNHSLISSVNTFVTEEPIMIRERIPHVSVYQEEDDETDLDDF